MSHPYERLTPDLILAAVAQTGVVPDGRLLALNSYENRVFQVGLEDGPPMIVKFYRPERWEDAALAEEHAFAAELATAEIPVVAPWVPAGGEALGHYAGFRFALFPRRGGRAPEPGDLDQLEWIGRFLGRIHLAAGPTLFRHRPTLEPQAMGWAARDQVLHSALLPAHEHEPYAEVSETLLRGIEAAFADVTAVPIRVHGDCHHGNILWAHDGPHFVDLDDCRNGPAVQDLWMLLHGDRMERTLQLSAILDGYRVFHELDTRELALIEPLRGLRMIHHCGWLARRWSDPAFPAAFPWAATPHYWSQHVHDLREQIAALQEPPLQLY